MLKDIDQPKVEDIAVAIVSEISDNPETVGEQIYNVYLLNLSEKILEGILVSSKGYKKNQNTGETTNTSMLRHSLDIMIPHESKKIEPIMEDVFHLNNEYWVSYFIDGKMYDKKYVFIAGIVDEKNFVEVPVVKKKGVMIK